MGEYTSSTTTRLTKKGEGRCVDAFSKVV